MVVILVHKPRQEEITNNERAAQKQQRPQERRPPAGLCVSRMPALLSESDDCDNSQDQTEKGNIGGNEFQEKCLEIEPLPWLFRSCKRCFTSKRSIQRSIKHRQE